MSDGDVRDRSLLPLADRLRWMQLNRLVLVVAPVLVWELLPQYRTAGAPSPWLVSAALLLLGAVGVLVALTGRRAALGVLRAGQLLDAVFLAWAFHLLGGLDGPIGMLVLVHVSAVTLLTSFRAGVRLAAGEGVLLLIVVQAEHDGLLGQAAASGPVRVADLAALVCAIGLAALGTATYGAVNERELRRRRHDAQVLRDFAVDLETATTVDQVARRLLVLACEDLIASAAALVLLPDDPTSVPRGAGAPSPALLARAGRDGEVQVRADVVDVPPDSPVARALARRSVELVHALDPRTDGDLGELLPGATRVVVVPVHAARTGVLLLAFGTSGRPDRLRRRGVARRVVAAAEQALAHAVLAISRIELIGQLTAAADRDGLTGVANRRSFDTALARAVEQSATTGDPCAVVLVDLDHFKQLNDTYGHLAGDEALRSAATAMAGTCRAGELLARYGGEEFAVVLPGCRPDEVLVVAERLRAAVAAAPAARAMTASLGVASLPWDGSSGEQLLAAADSALYRAKAGGRDRCEVATPSHGPSALLTRPA